MRNILWTMVACILIISTTCNGSIFNLSITPDQGDLYKSADYSVWIPGDARIVRGIILHQHGCGRNGIMVPYDIHWQRLADKWNCALMGSHLVPAGNCSDWNDPASGSEKAFLNAINKLAEQSNHPELCRAPWILWGHSGGAFWTTRMLDRHPEKIVCAFPRSGAEGTQYHGNLKVPVMHNMGIREEKDFNRIWNKVNEAFDSYRSKDALMALAIDPKSSHDCRNSRLLAIPFFDTCMAMRLPDLKDGIENLKPIDETKAWLGNNETFEIAPINDYKGDKSKASWLPDEQTAIRWQEYVQTGWVSDNTAPDTTPYNVKAVAVCSDTVELTWDAKADLQSGIKTFYYYRDGILVGQYSGSDNNTKGFQYGNYGDEPNPESIYKDPEKWNQPRMIFADTGLTADTEYIYQVSTVNFSDLESEKSKPVKVRTPKLILEENKTEKN